MLPPPTALCEGDSGETWTRPGDGLETRTGTHPLGAHHCRVPRKNVPCCLALRDFGRLKAARPGAGA